MDSHAEHTILLIEDDKIERMKFHRTLNKGGFKNKVLEATHGEEGLALLESSKVLPDLIFLDLNMPRVSGLEFLKAVKENDRLKHIPCVIITTSSNNKDLLECYRLGIAGYILKPLRYDEYVDHLTKAIEYWNINEIQKGNLGLQLASESI
jgi:CheY-like chemotaxis protein